MSANRCRITQRLSSSDKYVEGCELMGTDGDLHFYSVHMKANDRNN